jgi:hypothetical protein
MHGKKIPALLLLIPICSLWALEPPTRAEMDQYLRDGSYSARLQKALALGNNRIDPALLRNFRARLSGLIPRTKDAGIGDRLGDQTLPSGRRNGLPTKGSVKIFALLIDFPDYPAVNAAAAINAKLFGDGDTGYPYESLRNYYRRSSYNLLDIGGTTLGWYRPSYTRASMAQTTAAREALIKEALQYFHNQGHNFSQYDNDGNNTIDYFGATRRRSPPRSSLTARISTGPNIPGNGNRALGPELMTRSSSCMRRATPWVCPIIMIMTRPSGRAAAWAAWT